MWPASFPVGYLTLTGDGDTPIPLGANKILLFPKMEQFLSWGHWDQTLRICSLDTGKLLSVIESKMDDDTLCADTHKNGTIVVTGGTACVVKVWKVIRSKNPKNSRTEQLQLHSMLYGHVGSIVSVCISQEWSIILSGSKDKTCIMWDFNRLSYVRTLWGHEGPITSMCISPINGNIVTVDESKKGSTLRLWGLNGNLNAKNSCTEKVLCAKFTSGIEGIARNVVITGLKSGGIKIWDAWDLTLLRTLEDGHKTPVTALAITSDHTQLISADESGLLVCWSIRKPREAYLPMGI